MCVSVVSHGQEELLDALLVDIAELPAGTVQQIVVTLNMPNPTWKASATPRAADTIVLRNSRPLGFGANHNRAFAHCAQPHFAVVNPDIRLAADPFPALLDHLSSNYACALAAPIQLDARGQRESFARDVPTPWRVLVRRLFPGRERPPAAPAWVAGAFMLWRSEAFGQLKGFDERFFLYCEDVDICLRLQLAGGGLAVVDSARVIHAAQRSSGRLGRHLAWHLQSLLRLWLSPAFWRYVTRRPAL